MNVRLVDRERGHWATHPLPHLPSVGDTLVLVSGDTTMASLELTAEHIAALEQVGSIEMIGTDPGDVSRLVLTPA